MPNRKPLSDEQLQQRYNAQQEELRQQLNDARLRVERELEKVIDRAIDIAEARGRVARLDLDGVLDHLGKRRRRSRQAKADGLSLAERTAFACLKAAVRGRRR